jgi:hypothetical protein
LPVARSACGFRALAQRIVKHDDVGPFCVTFPVFGLGNETVGDVAFSFGFNEITNVVAFFLNLPGDVADEARDRGKKKFTLVHCESVRLRYGLGMVRRIRKNRVTKCSKSSDGKKARSNPAWGTGV